MNTYGYIRVSTKEQNEDRQMIAMREFGVVDRHIILDKQSGKDFTPPVTPLLSRASTGWDETTMKFWSNGVY